MAMDKIVAPLARVPIFLELSPAQITAIAAHAERVRFSPGAIITQLDQPGDSAYLIVSGFAECVAELGACDLPRRLDPGALIGELAMLAEYNYRSTALARERVFCLKLTRANMHGQMREDPTLRAHFEHYIRRRVMAAAEEFGHVGQLLTDSQLRLLAGQHHARP
jgi:CRP-like cAMP-binding protein